MTCIELKSCCCGFKHLILLQEVFFSFHKQATIVLVRSPSDTNVTLEMANKSHWDFNEATSRQGQHMTKCWVCPLASGDVKYKNGMLCTSMQYIVINELMSLKCTQCVDIAACAANNM